MIVATAGHIDHGKTALVKALTGVDADRLPEEKARGITVDLGFAYGRFGDGTIGFVDVPGHERLVRTMVAGATGVGFVLLAVAADDGVMPQTLEHIAILDLLGLRRGVVAITKSDRVDAGRIAEVEVQVRAALAGTGLARLPVIACSALSGHGIADLGRHLADGAESPPSGTAGGDFRLAVDRCFTVTGAGLVVTGSIHAGSVRPGDTVLVSPAGVEARVRGLRAGHEAVAAAGAGQRCALNLTGARLSRAAIHRGDWILAPHLHGPTDRLDVALRLLPGEGRPLRHRMPVHVHLGAASATGRVLLPPGTAIEPGGMAPAQIVLDASLGALHGDRFVLRDVSAVRTIGGGRVIDIDGPRRGAWAPKRRAEIEALDTGDHRVALVRRLDLGEEGVDLDGFARSRNIPAADMASLTRDLAIVGVEAPRGRRGFARTRIDALGASILAALADVHRAEPDNPGLTAGEIGGRMRTADGLALRCALDILLAGGRVARRGPHHHLPGHEVHLAAPVAALYAAVRATLEEAGLDQPRLADLAARVDHEPEALRGHLDTFDRLGWLRRVSNHYYVLPAVLARLADHARTVAAEHPQTVLTVGRFREVTGISRNMTMPVLTFFDAQGFTMRVAEGRIVRSGRHDF